MAELKQAWARVRRFRDRYRAVLESAPADLLSFVLIPEDRRREIGVWFGDCADFGITCCVYLHHLVDWADADPSVPADKAELRSFVASHESLRAIGDLCNGTKHAVLDRKPWSDEEVSVERSVRLHGSQAADGRPSARARHTVRIGEQAVPLLDLIDEAIAVWDGKLRGLKIGAYASEKANDDPRE